MEDRIVALVERSGPLTGAEIRDALGDASYDHYRATMRSERLAIRRIGRRYLRLDTRVDGYARLSPSILREFLTYTVVGRAGDEQALERRAAGLEAHIAAVTRHKLELARRIATEIAARAAGGDEGSADAFCIVVAGDVVYGMAHDVPRPERSTGTMVAGSDLDLVVLVDDDAPEALVDALDRATYERKYRYLTNPAFREEVDYVVKRLTRLREQAAFDGFKAMVACKIFDEAELLLGSRELFAAGKAVLRERGVADRLGAMEEAAVAQRAAAEEHLLASEARELTAPNRYLFYTDLESDEFE